jgi:UDP-2-acetamido-2,6-beta-L-arabino-hexul-4-ose reductase
VISDPAHELELSYVEDVVAAFLAEIDNSLPGEPGAGITSSRIQLGDLAGRIKAFHDMKATLLVPDFTQEFNRALYATYLSYVPPEARQQQLTIRSDNRGSLAEFVKQEHFGQIFVSRTRPGVTRGNHYHQTKTEKFFVLQGNAMIRLRAIDGDRVETYPISGDEYRVIDIPPGFTHSITNIGEGELVTLFWSSEIFNPDRPDTYYLPVDREEQSSSKKVGNA